jgi:2,5-furandicarboxylate decarboxylase 1
MLDLRSFLAAHPDNIRVIDAPMSVNQEVTALQHVLENDLEQPVLRIAKPILDGGQTSAMPVVTNLCADRSLIAGILGFNDHRNAAIAMAKLVASPIEPARVSRANAPVQEMVLQGDDASVLDLPILRQHALDAGPYLTAGHCTMADRDSGIDNTAIQRCMVKGPRLLSILPYTGSHNARNIQSFWRHNEPCPVAIWVGHHPAIVIGSQAKLGYPQSHWAVAGGFAREALRLVPSITHGERIMVPADAEIVIEGFIPVNRMEADGPFGEYTGYFGEQVVAPVIEVTCITRRKDAIYHDIGAGLPDHLVPDNMGMEAKIYTIVKAVAPSLINVHVPYSGRRFHAYLQFDRPPVGEVRDALTSALSYRRLRTAFAVDRDIDIFNDQAMMWALSTRVQWHRDQIRIDGLTHPSLDPSKPLGVTTVTKVGFDATLPPSPHGLPSPTLPVLSATKEAEAKARVALKR